ncbi:MAG: hypothetical protein K2X86_09175 [Cytophagaceae bacterium]|nr:hypothetical protein [Cytophagaceae bacterium]
MEEKQKKKTRPNALSAEPYKRRTELEMLKITKEIQSGLISVRGASHKYGLNRNTLKRWMTQIFLKTLHEEKYPTIGNMTEDQRNAALTQKVKELTKALELSKLKIEGLETMIKVAEKDLLISSLNMSVIKLLHIIF